MGYFLVKDTIGNHQVDESVKGWSYTKIIKVFGERVGSLVAKEAGVTKQESKSYSNKRQKVSKKSKSSYLKDKDA